MPRQALWGMCVPLVPRLSTRMACGREIRLITTSFSLRGCEVVLSQFMLRHRV